MIDSYTKKYFPGIFVCLILYWKPTLLLYYPPSGSFQGGALNRSIQVANIKRLPEVEYCERINVTYTNFRNRDLKQFYCTDLHKEYLCIFLTSI